MTVVVFILLVVVVKPDIVEFLRGHFGGPPPLEYEIRLTNPIDACGSTRSIDSQETFIQHLTRHRNSKRAVRKSAKGAIVVTRRGGCAFSQKSEVVEEMGGSAFIVINKT